MELEKPSQIAADTDDASSSQTSEPWDTEFLLEAQKKLEENMKALFGGSLISTEIMIAYWKSAAYIGKTFLFWNFR